MDEDFVDSNDVLIYNQAWNNFDSEVFICQQSNVNFDSTMMNKFHANPLDPLLDVSPPGFDPIMIHNHDTSANINLVGVNVLDHNFNNCMDQIRFWTKRAMMAYKERESALEHSICNQDFLKQQIKQQDEVIKCLQKEVEQEKVRTSQQVNRYKRELCEMEKLLKGYKEQLKDVNIKFGEYKARVLHNMTHSDNALRSQGPILSTKLRT